MPDPFKREISGALKATIAAHGPITEEWVGSAAKRIAGMLRAEMKRERDAIARTTPKQDRPATNEIVNWGLPQVFSHPGMDQPLADRTLLPTSNQAPVLIT